MRFTEAGFAFAALALLTGCPSFATLKTARALDPGQLQVTSAAEVLGMAAPAGKQVGGVRPAAIVAGRYGVVDGLDLGFRVEPVAGVTGESTIQLARGAVDLALGPSVGYFQAPGPISYAPKTIEEMSETALYTTWTTSVPILLGINFHGGHQLVLAPRASAWFVQPSPSTAATPSAPGGVELFAGLSAGFSIKTSANLRVMPEIDVTSPITWTGRSADLCVAASCAVVNEKALIVQGGLAFTVGADSLGK